MRDIQRLIEQLSAPLERPSWPPSAGHPPQQVLVLPDKDSSFALVVWVERGEGTIKLLPASGAAGATYELQRIAAAAGRQLLAVNKPPADATHLLVMGWTRQRRAPPPWEPRPFDHPFEPTFEGLVAWRPSLPGDVLQGALNELLEQSPDKIDSSLRELPKPVTKALLTDARDQPQHTLRASLTVPDQQTELPRLKALMSVADPPQQQPLQATHLVFSSCQYPAGLLDHSVASASFRRLQDTAVRQGPLGALLLLGDQIYADATYGILDPSRTSDRFVQLYADLHEALSQYPAIDAMRKAAEPRLYVTPDDHEIHDNWEPGGSYSNESDRQVALEVFEHWRLGRLPEKQRLGGYWGAVEVGGGHQVFMLDTRTTRDPRPWGPRSGGPAPHILNKPQRQALESWLRGRQQQDGAGPVSPKLISSPVWLLPRRVGRAVAPDDAADRSDGWDGYPASLHWLLGFIATQKVRGVVMLCGDAHLAGHTRVELKHQEQAVQLHVLHAPALYAPFPFANGQPHHYRCHQDQWNWADDSISSRVDSELWALGDGFIHLSVEPVDSAWRVRATFDTAPYHGRSEFWTVN